MVNPLFSFIFQSTAKTVLLGIMVCSSSLLQAQMLEVENGYVRGLPPGTTNTSAYMTILNHGPEAVVLTGANTDVAASVMLHTTTNHDGMLHMEHVMSAEIPAHGKLVLESGGMHLMLMQLTKPLSSGAQINLALQFSDGTELPLTLSVRSILDE